MSNLKRNTVWGLCLFALMVFCMMPLKSWAEAPVGTTPDNPVRVRTFKEFHDILEVEDVKYISVENDFNVFYNDYEEHGTNVHISQYLINVKGEKKVDMNNNYIYLELSGGRGTYSISSFITVEDGSNLHLFGAGGLSWKNSDNKIRPLDGAYENSAVIDVESGGNLRVDNVAIMNYGVGSGILANGHVLLEGQAQVRASEGWAVFSYSDDAWIDLMQVVLQNGDCAGNLTPNGLASYGALGIRSPKAKVYARNTFFRGAVGIQTSDQQEKISSLKTHLRYKGTAYKAPRFWQEEEGRAYPIYVEWGSEPIDGVSLMEIYSDDPATAYDVTINDIRTPMPGAPADFTCYDLPPDSRVMIQRLEWYDENNHQIYSFESGIRYTVMAYIQPIKDCMLCGADLLSCTIKINGEEGKLERYDGDAEGAWVSYQFPPCVQPVSLKPIFDIGGYDIVEPKSGQTPDRTTFKPFVPSVVGKYDILKLEWYDEAGNPAQKFEEGVSYTAELTVKPGEGYRLAPPMLLNCRINYNAENTFLYKYLGETEGAIVRCVFPPCASEDPVREFVKRLYKEILGRDADEDGLNAWTENLKSGREQGAKVAQGFVESKEFKEKAMSDEEYIRIMYKTFLNREADAGGLNAWKDVLDSGMSKMHVFKGFVESPEFTEICKSYNIIRGNVHLTAAMDQPENELVTKFVGRCYKVFLGRRGDEAGINGWVKALVSGSNSAKEAAYGFVMSNEFQDMNLNNENYVKTMYIGLLDREADPAGLAGWVQRLNEGGSRLEIFYGFADSSEFRGLAQKYNLNNNWPSTIR